VDLNGAQVFSYDFETAVEATPMIHDSVLYIGRIDGNMYAISLSRKDVLWNYETMGQVAASAKCVAFGGRQAVVFGSYDNYLDCLDSKTGEELNRFESGYYINGAVALWEQYVIFGGCDGWLRVIDCQTGVATDSLQVDSYIPAAPAIMGGYCYVGDHSGNIYELFLEKGKIIRHQTIMEATGDGAFVSVPAVSADRLYILTNDQHLYSINRKDGSVHWKYLLKGAAGESSPVICRDKIIVCTKSGVVSILDARTGTLEWEYDTGEQIVASPAVIKDRFYILTARGTLFCFGEKK
jgi:outer membrane protein assembly factor BamB